MYNKVAYQIDKDPELQAKQERQFAPELKRRLQQNLAAFRHHIPSLIALLERHTAQQYAVFCNKWGLANIADFANGMAMYRQSAKAESQWEYQQFQLAAPFFSLQEQQAAGQQVLPPRVDLLVMLGLGAGYQLEYLLEQHQIRSVIVYEPSADLFVCSAQLADWLGILQTAATKGTNLFLQIGKDASGLPEDLSELLQLQAVEQVFVYRHYSHPVMDKVWHYCQLQSGDRAALLNTRQHFVAYNSQYDEVEIRHASTASVLSMPVPDHPEQQFQQNLAALKQFYPQIYEVIREHQPKHWQLVCDHLGRHNLWHAERRALFYQDVEHDSQRLIDEFCQHPFQDDVLIGHRPTFKLRSYLHNQQVQKLLPILERNLKKNTVLPQRIDSLIVFGIGLGVHLGQLRQQHQIKNWYICEPNLDFFYASLFVTDWAALFQQAQQEECRIYLNLGGDGSEYFADLMRQFYQVGAYSIANTYMLTSYFNQRMNNAIHDLRSELRVVLAIGEYFDHARFNLAHAYQVFKAGAKLLKRGLAAKSHPVQQVPVFIVGNGPSLDQCFDYLRHYQQQAIIISCGTALRALHNQGIRPDFHAELEQNRASYEWVMQVKDLDYLKQIRMLSINGVHPDTAALFAEVLLCFKDGESSTQLYEPLFNQHGLVGESLAYAYPTVTNFVLNLLLKIGFHNLYLFGVDLGFVDINHHHSKSSAYYVKGQQQLYDYQKIHGGGLPVLGNFRPFVYTKPEFNVSRKLQEVAIKNAKGKCDVYNCSDGAQIRGAVALHPDNILLQPLSCSKEAILDSFIADAYLTLPPELVEYVPASYDLGLFEKTMLDWQALLAAEVNSEPEAKALIERQWLFLLKANSQKTNPAFMLFNGSTNYFSAILLKLAVTDATDERNQIDVFNEVLAVWREYLQLATEQFLTAPLAADQVTLHKLFQAHESNK
ncbi:motility associated factor glycosyltransferase family protein [Alishewanella sp. BS5-314]|uniref:motility associated factor glycosyltransferase family protein n=1 Tax=Alishewanella sp. BS5-314 TaxID=2755587 RepID=UPI0021BA4821|nr:6-hydroxymethylpterin diphosphokinase MptE-like protein [Alishewanella sp. BS5-314]MCT8125519.1 motility associated factor glycosyltransferase family protein [Alishewanella sp. BS5-314]